jgi:hypothetical protein
VDIANAVTNQTGGTSTSLVLPDNTRITLLGVGHVATSAFVIG